MSKLQCPCGYVHDTSPATGAGWTTIRDRDYERVVDAHLIERDPQSDSDLGSTFTGAQLQANQTILGAWGHLYECPKCERVMWKREGATQFRVFLPERPGPG